MPKFPRDDVDPEDGDIDGQKRCVHCGELSPKLLFLDKMLKPTETDLFCRLEGSIESLMKSAEYRSPAGKAKLADHQFRKIDQWLANLKSKYQRTLDQSDIDQLHNQVRKLIKFQAAQHEKNTGTVAVQPPAPIPRDKTFPPLQRRPYRNRIGKQRAKSKVNSQHCKNCNGWVTPIEMRGKNEGKLPIKKCIECRTSRYIWQKVRQQRGNPSLSSGRLLDLVTQQALDSLDAWEKGLKNKSTIVGAEIMDWLKNGVQEEVHNRIERETGNGNFMESPANTPQPGDTTMDTTVTENIVDEYAASFGDQTEDEAGSPSRTIDDDGVSSDLSPPPQEMGHNEDKEEEEDVDMTSNDHLNHSASNPKPTSSTQTKAKTIKLRVSPRASVGASETAAQIAPPVFAAHVRAIDADTRDHSPASWAASMVRLTKELRDAQMDLTTAEFSRLVETMRQVNYFDPDQAITLIEKAVAEH